MNKIHTKSFNSICFNADNHCSKSKLVNFPIFKIIIFFYVPNQSLRLSSLSLSVTLRSYLQNRTFIFFYLILSKVPQQFFRILPRDCTHCSSIVRVFKRRPAISATPAVSPSHPSSSLPPHMHPLLCRFDFSGPSTFNS